MKRITGRFEAEITVKKSRFIAIAMPVTGLDDVKSIVKSIWDEHKDATHVVHAAVAGANVSLFSCSDDREPKNTAGRPALEVLKGSGITDIIVCIVRYFGGTLLGTGGPVKAYGESGKEVLRNARTEEKIPRIPFSIFMGHENLDKIKRALYSCGIKNLREDFAGGITIKGELAQSGKEKFAEDFTSITMGRAQLTWN